MFEIYQFEDFQLNKKNRALFLQGKQLHLSQKAFEILLFLVEHQGEIITKEELLEEIWANSFVEEGNLAVQMSALRNLLGEKRGEYKYIQTVTGKGYCFVANVEKQEVEKISSLSQRKSVDENDLSIAVLPFSTRCKDETSEFLAEGITESLISNLSQLPQLKVMAYSAVSQYKDKETDLQEIAFILGVGKILTGKIIKFGENLVISVELINSKDLTQIWGEQYEFQPEDLFKLKKEISHKIVESLKLKLTKKETTKLNKQNTSSTIAYKLYLQGRKLMDDRTQSNLLKSIEYFEQALKIDSNFALAYTGIADANIFLGNFYFTNASEIIPRAKSAIETAMKLDQNLSESYTSQGFLYLFFDYNPKIVESSLRRALELNSNNAIAHHWYSFYLMNFNMLEECLYHQYKALELDPLSYSHNAGLANRFLLLRDYAKAISISEEALTLYPNNYNSLYHLTIAHIKLGMLEKAMEYLERGIKELPILESFATKAHILALMGKTEAARKVLNELIIETQTRPIDFMDIAHAFVALGDFDKAFDYLEKARLARLNHFCLIKVDPRFDNLHSDPRFDEFLHKIGL